MQPGELSVSFRLLTLRGHEQPLVVNKKEVSKTHIQALYHIIARVSLCLVSAVITGFVRSGKREEVQEIEPENAHF